MSGPSDLLLSALPANHATWYASMLAKVDTAMAALQGITGSTLPTVRARLMRYGQFGAEARFAGARNPGYEVRLYAALPAIVHFALNCMMRTSEFMPGLGDVRAEQRHREKAWQIPLSLPRGVNTETAIVSIVSSSRPKDQNRAWVAALMTELAMAFCTYHEIAHIMLGHVSFHRYSTRRLGLLEMSESALPVGRANRQLRLVWEYEADLMAANLLLQDMLAPPVEAVFQEAYGMHEAFGALDRLQVMLSAVLVVFLLVAQATSRHRHTHPDPLVRFVAVADDISAALAEHHPGLGLNFKIMRDAINDVAEHTVGAWSGQGLGTSPASPVSRLQTAQRTIRRLEQQRQEQKTTYRSHAMIYPFRG